MTAEVPAATPTDRLMMISIHPRHVESILSGTKTVEFRRSQPVIGTGQPAVIYATLPLAAVVATCRIGDVHSGSPTEVWKRYRLRGGIGHAEFRAYFSGKQSATAIEMTCVAPLFESVSLQELRGSGSFQPPQTWRFLDRDRVTSLFGSHPSINDIDSMLGGSLDSLQRTHSTGDKHIDPHDKATRLRRL